MSDTVSLVDVIRQGGCYWKQGRFDSPGHSIVIPNGTPFKIALDGAKSHRFTTGVCRDGYFVVQDGAHAAAKFASASEAVNAIRRPSTNAFLYLQLMIEGKWIVTDAYRQLEKTRLDEVEEEALDLAVAAVEACIRKNGKKPSDFSNVKKVAANLVAKNPQFIASAKQIVAGRRALSVQTLRDITGGLTQAPAKAAANTGASVL